jgi:glutamine synthetase
VGFQAQGSPEDIATRAQESGIRHVRALLTDLSGQTRVKLVTVERLAAGLRSGIGLSSSIALINAADHLVPHTSHFDLAVGEIRLMPDPATLVPLPYAPGHGAALVDMVGLDGAPFPVCPRYLLGRQVERLADTGFRAAIGQENEWFFLLPDSDGEGFRPAYHAPYYGSAALQVISQALTATVEALEAQGIGVEQYHPEAGQGQCEVSSTPADPVAAADRQVLTRETIKNVAHQHGYTATLAPKPFEDDIGSGVHVHVSLWDGERNAFHNPTGRYGLSSTAEQFIAGLLAHLPALAALTSPTVNSYSRFLPGAWSSAFICWGFQNRECAVRACHGIEWTQEESTNVELKVIDASCNPYIALAGVLAAGRDGIERELKAPEPLEVAPGTLSDEERARRGICPLPQSLHEALNALEQDAVLLDALGDVGSETFLAVKRLESEIYSQHDKEFERSQHILRF